MTTFILSIKKWYEKCKNWKNEEVKCIGLERDNKKKTSVIIQAEDIKEAKI